MTDTRHLDTAIAIFKGKGAKRAPKNRVFYVIAIGAVDPSGSYLYCIQFNGRVLEDLLPKDTAIEHAQNRSARASATTGKAHSYALME
jgi:hypothetical protein